MSNTFAYMPLAQTQQSPEPVIDLFDEAAGALPEQSDLVETLIALPKVWPTEDEVRSFYNDLAGDCGWRLLWDDPEARSVRVSTDLALARVPAERV